MMSIHDDGKLFTQENSGLTFSKSSSRPEKDLKRRRGEGVEVYRRTKKERALEFNVDFLCTFLLSDNFWPHVLFCFF